MGFMKICEDFLLWIRWGGSQTYFCFSVDYFSEHVCAKVQHQYQKQISIRCNNLCLKSFLIPFL